MIRIFKTSIDSITDAKRVRDALENLSLNPNELNFDLEDCDRILRIVNTSISSNCIINTVKKIGFSCEELH